MSQNFMQWFFLKLYHKAQTIFWRPSCFIRVIHEKLWLLHLGANDDLLICSFDDRGHMQTAHSYILIWYLLKRTPPLFRSSSAEHFPCSVYQLNNFSPKYGWAKKMAVTWLGTICSCSCLGPAYSDTLWIGKRCHSKRLTPLLCCP